MISIIWSIKLLVKSFKTSRSIIRDKQLFFSDEHFPRVSSKELRAPDAKTDLELIEELRENDKKSIKFPGAVTDKGLFKLAH